jgi:hypothetical protein
MVAAPLMVAGAGIALGMIMARDKSIAPLTKGGGNVFGGRGGGASTGIFEQQKNSQVHVSNLSDIAPALTPIFGSLPGKTGQSVSAAIKGVKLQAKVEDDGSGKATAEHTSIISGLTSSHLPLLSTQTSAHLPSIHQNTQTTADRVGTTNGHMMELIGAVKAPPKVNIKVTVA